MRSAHGFAALLASLLWGPALHAQTVPAQQDTEAGITRAAIAAVFPDLPRKPLIIDGTTHHGSAAVATMVSKELRTRTGLLGEVLQCSESPRHTQKCDMREDVVAVLLHPIVIAGDSATVSVSWWYQDAPGVVGGYGRTFRARRTPQGAWVVTELSRLRT